MMIVKLIKSCGPTWTHPSNCIFSQYLNVFLQKLEKYFIKDGDVGIFIVNNHDQRPKLSTTQILQWWSSHGQAMHIFNIIQHNFKKNSVYFFKILQIVLQKVIEPQRWNAVFNVYDVQYSKHFLRMYPNPPRPPSSRVYVAYIWTSKLRLVQQRV